MQLGFVNLHVIARSVSDEAISKKGLLRFARNDREILFRLHPKSQLLKLIADLGIKLSLGGIKL